MRRRELVFRRRTKAADLAAGTWPDLTGHLKPHDYRHTQATWLEEARLSKVIQMDRRGHAMPGMDRVDTHVTTEMREQLSAVLEDLWREALEERHGMSDRSSVPLLDAILTGRECHSESDLDTRSAIRLDLRPVIREAET